MLYINNKQYTMEHIIEYNWNDFVRLLNVVLVYFNFRTATNIPSIKTSPLALTYTRIYYSLIVFCLGCLSITRIYYVEKKNVLGLQNVNMLSNYIFTLNCVDFLICVLYYFYTKKFIYYEVDADNQTNNLTELNDKDENEEDDEDEEDEENEDDTEADEEDEEEDDEEDDEEEEDEEDDDEDDMDSETDSVSNIVSGLSDECVNEIKEILGDYNERKLRLLIRTINKHLNK